MKSIRNMLVTCAAMLALAIPGNVVHAAEGPDSDPMSEANILRDPNVPVLGNPNGDITIVEYFDYQCPYCKKFNPDLAKIVREDGHIRLVFKDWPVFGGPSVYAAKLVLASKYQNKFAEAHEALISLPQKLTEDGAQNALVQAGIDVERAKQDLAAHQQEIEATLSRNNDQALAFGFQGTPSFIIGHYRVPGVLDPANFKRAIADARAADKKKSR